MQRVLFIINPISGTGKKKVIEKLAPQILGSGFSVDFSYTQNQGDGIIISKQNVNNYDIIVAVGGDGTINEVAKGLIGHDCTLAIIPQGSGNGFARFLKIPLSIKDSLALIKTGKKLLIDTATINSHAFVNIMGVGFDAEVGRRFANYGKRGALPYIKIVLKEFNKYKSKNYDLLIDDTPVKTDAFLLSVANSSQWGLNAHIAPQASINDGMLDISILSKFPLSDSIPLSVRLFNKTIDKSKYIKTYTGKEIILKNNEPLTAHIDGDPIEFNSDIHIKVNPDSLHVIVPK